MKLTASNTPASKSTTLSDTDPMPFGKYRGMAMQDVPVSYLHWYWHNGTFDTQTANAVADYIMRSMDALKQENPDLVWSRKK